MLSGEQTDAIHVTVNNLRSPARLNDQALVIPTLLLYLFML